MPQLSIFLTDLGWFGLWGEKKHDLLGLTIGHATTDEVRRAVRKRCAAITKSNGIVESDWHPQLRSRLEKYAQGRPIDFDGVKVPLGQRTPFQQRVLEVTRKIKYGQTMTYGELAVEAGSPRAARAVGSVMASNRFPIIIPCHRVVASSGKLGGFSAPQGVGLKVRMLDLEAENCVIKA